MSLKSWREQKLNECKDFPSHLYYFAHKDNFENILKFGILNKKEIKERKLKYTSFALEEVQDIRSETKIPKSGLGGRIDNHDVHDFVPLYFTSKTPTLYAVKEDQENFFFLKINSRRIITDERIDFSFCNGNAASSKTNYYSNLSKLNRIDWKIIHSKYWNEFEDGKRKRNSEFLIYGSVDLKYVDEILLNSNRYYDDFVKLKEKYKNNISININKEYFF